MLYRQLLTSRRVFHALTYRIVVVRCIACAATPASEKFSWLKDHSPRFGINGRNVTVLDGPQHFYNALKSGINDAKRRVVLASLYIGEGPMEQALIDSLLSRCSESTSSGAPIDVQVLLDYTRGSRGVTNSRTLLLPLLERYRNTSQVALYHTPNLRGALRAVIPERYNEVIGLSHLKVYLFDDSLVLSGANLSNDYFTNRQDRYILFRDVPEVSDFFCQLVSTISTFSLQLGADNSIDLHPSFQIHPFRDNIKTFKKEASKLVKSVIDPTQDNGGRHDPPYSGNHKLNDAITDKFTGLSKSIPTKERMISRNYSSLSQDCLISNAEQETFLSENNSELKLLDLLEKRLTVDPHIRRLRYNPVDDEPITNIKSEIYIENNAGHKDDISACDDVIHGKHTPSFQPLFDSEVLPADNSQDFKELESYKEQLLNNMDGLNTVDALPKCASPGRPLLDNEVLIYDSVPGLSKPRSSCQPIFHSDSMSTSNKSSQCNLTARCISTNNRNQGSHQYKTGNEISDHQRTGQSSGYDGITGGQIAGGDLTACSELAGGQITGGESRDVRVTDGQITGGGFTCREVTNDAITDDGVGGGQTTAGEVDTWLYPLIQMGPLGITVDQEVTGKLLQTSGEDSTCVLASGYFNLVEEYLDLITSSSANYRILMASPQVNGFYKAKGFAGFIPDAYTFIARKFYNRMRGTGQLQRVKLYEYHKQKWTFHAKGLWLCINGQDLPSLTLIGSPNFGYRSVHRDLEAQVAMVTENPGLQRQLHQEHVRLFNESKPVSEATFNEPDRTVPLWVRLIVPIIKNFF